MIRYVSAVLCVLAGATALVLSAFGDWIGDRDGKDIPLSDLWSGLGSQTVGLATSLFVPLVIAAALAVLGALTRLRLVLALAALIGLATAGMFMLQQGRTDSGFDHFHQGWTNAGGGALLLIVATAVLPSQRRATTVHSYEDQ
ncbi:hypothetical protein [Nocardia australiensis]|uniref:hypothetical protein n=1 Tax=Nocardia australiensis TaxID=2887191 RepID=UPI001D139A85|nr:hypothetical protein [Nocardia australiensis]